MGKEANTGSHGGGGVGEGSHGADPAGDGRREAGGGGEAAGAAGGWSDWEQGGGGEWGGLGSVARPARTRRHRPEAGGSTGQAPGGTTGLVRPGSASLRPRFFFFFVGCFKQNPPLFL
jgi:hypothetical protein